MIRSVRGRVGALAAGSAVVEVGGVGLALQCTPTTMAALRVGESVHLAASLVVREDSLTLYGFAEDDERACFEILQGATGVGPRLAQAMLAVHAPDDLRRAVAAEDLTALMAVPGVGRKGAQRIVLDLRDRLGPVTGAAATRPPAALAPGWAEQLHGALLGLGWSAREADDAVRSVTPQADAVVADGQEPDVSALLRSALRALGRR